MSKIARIGSFVLMLIVLLAHQHIVNGELQECPPHSTLNRCMSRCPITCSNFNNPPECLQVCTVGCECEPGFIKANKSPYAMCVKLYECPLYTKRTMPYPLLRKYMASAAQANDDQSRIHNGTIDETPTTKQYE